MNRKQMKWCPVAEYSLLILPALALGVFAMSNGGISPMIWGQQIAAWIVFPLLALLLKRVAGRMPTIAWSGLLLLLLALTLLGEEAGGARRWVDLGVFQVNAAMLILPALLVILCRMKHPNVVWLGTAAILSFQPDLSQAAAFGAAILPILWVREKKLLWKILNAIFLGVLIWRCLSVPTTLEPVAYCEGILTMLGDITWLLKAAGCVSLLTIPAFFAYGFYRQKKLYLLCLAVYYLVSMLFILSGEYPVPFMGFGISSIAGFWLWIVMETNETDR